MQVQVTKNEIIKSYTPKIELNRNDNNKENWGLEHLNTLHLTVHVWCHLVSCTVTRVMAKDYFQSPLQILMPLIIETTGCDKKRCYLSVLQTFSWAEATSTRMNPSWYSLLLSIWLVNIEMYTSKTGHSLRSTHLVSEVSCKTRSLLYQYKFCTGSTLKVCFVKKKKRRETWNEKFVAGN